MTKNSKRILSLYMLFTVCFMAILVRIVYINYSAYADAGKKQASRTVVVGTTRGKIYDRNLELLVDDKNRFVAAVTPVAASKKLLGSYFSDESLLEKIEKGYPFVATVKKEINDELIKTFSVPERYSTESVASHLVGYVDLSGVGVTGIEKSFERELSSHSGRLTVSFEVDALGRVLAGMNKTVNNENFNSKAGIVLTLDKQIQLITEKALEQSSIESGCAVVTEASTGDILALASVPDFDRNNVEKSLDKENSPLVNKALCAYSAGSVFKSIIAAFAIESGEGDFVFECEGSKEVGDKTFTCYDSKKHGKLDLSLALQESCNTYFISLMERLDTEKLLDFCKNLGFGEEVELCGGISGEMGILPDRISLSIPASRANFSFGQGDLLVTPLQLIKAYHVLATGFSAEPRVVCGFCDKNKELTREKSKKGQRLLSESTVKQMRKLLSDSVEKGIAGSAKSQKVQIAAKTGTAESGIFDEQENEVLRTWTAGFFPCDEPRYIVVLMNENGVAGSVDCAPVLREICEEIHNAQFAIHN